MRTSKVWSIRILANQLIKFCCPDWKKDILILCVCNKGNHTNEISNGKRVSSFHSYWEHLCVCAVTNNFDISHNIIILKALSMTGSPALHQQPCCSLRHHVLTPCRSISYHSGNTTDMKNTLTVNINSQKIIST